MDASRAVLQLAGGAYEASLNHYDAGLLGAVTTVQVDESVFVVGPSNFAVSRVELSNWLVRDVSRAAVIECDTAGQAWELLRHVREDCLLWQCGGCDGWLCTSNRPRVGVLGCSTCGVGGVDFRHADRAVGADDGD